MPATADHRRTIARISLAVAAVALGWSALLALTGGFDATLFGLTIRSHNWSRTLAAGLIAVTVFVWARGVRRLVSQAAPIARGSNGWLASRRIPHRAIALALAAAVLAFGVLASTGTAGGSDSYGYISQSDLWRRGLPIVAQPWTAQVPWPDADWTFSPLGYRPAAGGGAIVPVYAVGLPLLMAAASSLAGHAAIFWLVPIAGAVLVLLSFLVGRRLDSPAAGLVAAALTATSATMLGEVPSPMSDVIAGAALSGSLYLLIRTGADVRFPIAAGLAAGLAILVRPNLVFTLAVMALWILARTRRGERWLPARNLRQAAVLLAAAAPGIIVPAWANWRLYGSPIVSGYGDFATIYDWRNVLPNVAQYAELLISSRTFLFFVGLAALVIPAPRLWPRLADRSALVGIGLFVFSTIAQYLVYEFPSGEGYLRLLLPCWPFVMAGTARVLLAAVRPGWPMVLAAMVVAAQAFASIEHSCGGGGCDNRSERKYSGAGAIVQARTEPDSVIYAFQHSGSLRYYGGRLTLRYDLLDPAWLDRSVEWFAGRGIRTYAVLDAWEVPEFRARFAGQQRIAQIDQPVVTYRGAAITHFYDLTRPAGRQSVEEWVDRFDGPRFPRPVAPPAPLTTARTRTAVLDAR